MKHFMFLGLFLMSISLAACSGNSVPDSIKTAMDSAKSNGELPSLIDYANSQLPLGTISGYNCCAGTRGSRFGEPPQVIALMATADSIAPSQSIAEIIFVEILSNYRTPDTEKICLNLVALSITPEYYCLDIKSNSFQKTDLPS